MNIILENEFGDKLILDEDKSKVRIHYSHGLISEGYIKHPRFAWLFTKDECPGSNTNEDISLLSIGVVWSMGCGYSGTSALYPIPENLKEDVDQYFGSK